MFCAEIFWGFGTKSGKVFVDFNNESSKHIKVMDTMLFGKQSDVGCSHGIMTVSSSDLPVVIYQEYIPISVSLNQHHHLKS